MKCLDSPTGLCIKNDTDELILIPKCDTCTKYKNNIIMTKEEITRTFAIASTIALIIVSILLSLSGNRIKKLRQIENLYEVSQDSLKIERTAKNEETAKAEVFESENTALFTRLLIRDKDVIRLQNMVKNYEKKIGDLNTAIILNNETIIKLQDTIRSIIVSYTNNIDTPMIAYPVYYRKFDEKWYSGDVTMGIKELNLNFTVRNSYEVTIGNEKISIFKKKYYANITNLNPSTETKVMKVYQKDEVKTGIMKPFEIGGAVGLVIGYLLFH